jgi:hypothetical protein
MNVRLFADERDRDVVTDVLHQVLLAFLAVLGLRVLAAIFRRG